MGGIKRRRHLGTWDVSSYISLGPKKMWYLFFWQCNGIIQEREHMSQQRQQKVLGEVSFLVALCLIPDSNTYCKCAIKFCSNFTVSSSFHPPHISLWSVTEQELWCEHSTKRSRWGRNTGLQNASAGLQTL